MDWLQQLVEATVVYFQDLLGNYFEGKEPVFGLDWMNDLTTWLQGIIKL